METLVLHPITKKAIQKVIQNPSHALLLTGQIGAGKPTIAKSIISELLSIDTDRLTVYPYFSYIQPHDGSISIDDIRSLQRAMRLKTAGLKTIRRVALIEDAHMMTVEAQNAFLKLLEEPPADSMIIMTATNHNSLLPTIVSRAQLLQIMPSSKELLIGFFASFGIPITKIERAYHISGGQPGLMQNLLQNDTSHPMVKQIEIAKQLLTSSLFDRLIQIDNLAKQKSDLSGLLLALRRICRAALQQSLEKHERANIIRWNTAGQRLLKAETALTANPQPKLLLSDLLLNL